MKMKTTLTAFERRQLKTLLDCYCGWHFAERNGQFVAIDTHDGHVVPGTNAASPEECQAKTLGVALKCASVIVAELSGGKPMRPDLEYDPDATS
jgi:hypothetical protein